MKVNTDALTDLELAAILANPDAFFDELLDEIRREVQRRINREARKEVTRS